MGIRIEMRGIIMTMRENIKRLVKLNLLKNKGYYLVLCLVLIFWTLLQMIEVAGNTIEDSTPDYFAHMAMPGFVLLGALFINGIRDYNILSNDSISMYPGTVKSRFISRLICGHIEILGILFISIIMYLMQAVFIVILSRLSDNVVVGSAFHLPYLLWGLCRMLGFGLLAYAAWTLWYVIMERMQRYFCGVALGLSSIGIFVLFRLKGSIIWLKLMKIIGLYRGTSEKYPAYTGILLCLATWLVLLVAACLIGIRTKSWKKETRNNLIYSIVFLYLLVILSVGSVDFDVEKTAPPAKLDNVVTARLDVSDLSGEEIGSLAEMGICQYEDNAVNGNLKKWEEMNMATMSMSENEAKEYVPVPDGAVDRQHIYLMVWGENTMFAEKDMIRPFLEYYSKNVSVQRIDNGETVCTAVKRKPFVCPVNGVYGNLSGLLPGTTYDDAWFDYSDSSFLRQLIIYDDAYEQTEEPE